MEANMPKLVSLLFAVTTLAVAACDTSYHDMYGTWGFNEPVTQVIADIDASSLLVVPTSDEQSTVDLDIEWTHEEPSFEARLEGTTLFVDLECEHDCRGLIEVRVPAAASIDAEVGAGSIDIHRMDGDVVAWAGAGSIEARDLGSSSCDAHAGAGDVELTLTGTPHEVVAESGAGSVSVNVPKGTYDIEASSGAGNTSVEGLVADPGAPDSIYAHSGAGNVSVKGI
jgi:hypothetical protein